MASPVTLQDLINAKSADVVKAELISLLQSKGFDADDWNSGSQARTLLEIESASLAELWTLVSNIAKGMYLDTAEDGWLTLLAKSQYGLDRISAEYTRGIATFSLVPGLGPRTINAGEIVVSDGLGHNFTTDNPSPITLTTLTPSAAVPVISQTTGEANNIAAGTMTVINQGPADITVTNLGLPIAASITGTPILTLPIVVTGKTLVWTEFTKVGNTTVSVGKSLTFPANYATLTALITFLNGNATFNPNLVATPSGSALTISGKIPGPGFGFTFSIGTSNGDIGLSTTSSTSSTGGTSVDSPAAVYGAYLSGPFNVTGLNLRVIVTINGVQLAPQVYTFASNYPNISALATAIGESITGLVATNDQGRLKLATILNGPDQGIILSSLGTANSLLGFSSTLDQAVTGSSAWILQEGRDEESDASLRARCQSRWGILGAGTRDAFISWSRSANPKVQKVVVYSNYLNGTPKAGAVTVYVAGINSALDAATVLDVYNYILPRMPIMSELYVGSVTAVPIYFTGTLTVRAGTDIVSLKNQVLNNVTLYSQSLDIAETVYQARVISEIMKTNSQAILTFNIVKPPDTTLDKNQLAIVQEDPLTPLKIVIK